MESKFWWNLCNNVNIKRFEIDRNILFRGDYTFTLSAFLLKEFLQCSNLIFAKF